MATFGDSLDQTSLLFNSSLLDKIEDYHYSIIDNVSFYLIMSMPTRLSSYGFSRRFGIEARLKVFRGGCFFAAAAAEFDGRPGPVRDCIAEIMKEWLQTLRSAIIEAQRAGQLRADVDANQLAFEFNSLELGANWAYQLYGEMTAFKRAREAIHDRLVSYSTRAGSSFLSRTATKSSSINVP